MARITGLARACFDIGKCLDIRRMEAVINLLYNAELESPNVGITT